MSDSKKQTFVFYQMKHYLKDAGSLSPVALSRLTDTELTEYRKEYEEKLVPEWQKDRELADEIKGTAKESIRDMFGSYSKQYKYLERNLRNERNLFDDHYGKIVDPSFLEKSVKKARETAKNEGGYTKASSGVDSASMAEIDSAIKYLMDNGFEYGKDFSSHNAVEISEAHIPEAVDSFIHHNTAIEGKYIEAPESCDCIKWDSERSTVYAREISLSCDCYSSKMTITPAIEGGVLLLSCEQSS